MRQPLSDMKLRDARFTKKQILDEICKHCMKQFCRRSQTKERCPALKKDLESSLGVVNEGMWVYRHDLEAI